MSAPLAVMVCAVVALPHLLDLRKAAPPVAAALWGCALVLRALTMLFLVVYLLVFLPQTELFGVLTHWCWHAVLPVLATHLGLDGHEVGDAAVILPSFLVAASLLSVAFGVVRATRAVRALLRRAAVGAGPSESLIVAGSDVVVAAAGLTRPRVIVSAGALALLDDDELAAGLDHERGHIARRHRYVLVAAELCRGVARALPGTRRALRELSFHLERDADRWALERRHDRLALASAICKAATQVPRSHVALASLAGGSGIGERLGQLLDGEGTDANPAGDRLLRATAVAVVAVTLAVAAAMPAAAVAGSAQGSWPDAPHGHCAD